MLHKKFFEGSAEDWLRYARSDLEISKVSDLSDRILLEELCFHAQQAAEKALKAILIAKGVSFPRTHSISTLIEFLPEDIVVPSEVLDAAALTDYAVMTRYPSIMESVEYEEYKEAVRMAEYVLLWAEKIICPK